MKYITILNNFLLRIVYINHLKIIEQNNRGKHNFQVTFE